MVASEKLPNPRARVLAKPASSSIHLFASFRCSHFLFAPPSVHRYSAYTDALGDPAGDYLGTISQMDAQV